MVVWFRKLPRYDLDQKHAEAEDVAREIGRRFRAATAILLCSFRFVCEFFPHANITNLENQNVHLTQAMVATMWYFSYLVNHASTELPVSEDKTDFLQMNSLPWQHSHLS